MKKRIVLILLLLATLAYAQMPYDSVYPNASSDMITRYSNMPLDNIHILRIQEASRNLGGNVSLLRGDLRTYEEKHSADQIKQAQELSQLKSNMDGFQRTVLVQLSGLQTNLERMSGKATATPEINYPAQVNLPPYVIFLIGLNIFLLIIVIILIFWLREQYYVHKETHTEEHIHPAPAELINYVKHQFEHDKKIHDIRMELIAKGWTPSVIEHAIHAAREK